VSSNFSHKHINTEDETALRKKIKNRERGIRR